MENDKYVIKSYLKEEWLVCYSIKNNDLVLSNSYEDALILEKEEAYFVSSMFDMKNIKVGDV